jgi:DNA-binding NarL/FixJ family response regulator
VTDSRLFAIAFFRVKRDFSERDLAMLTRLRPALVLAHRAAQARTQARLALVALDHTLDQTPHALVLLGRDDEALGTVGDADALVRSYFHAGLARGLPDELGSWVRAQRHRLKLAGQSPLPIPLAKQAPHGRLEVRFIPRRGADGPDGLLLTEQPAQRLSARKLVGLNLTRREAQILQLVAAGRTNDQIATDLFLSIRTGKKHLENTYRKLEVRSRTAAVARALDLTSGIGQPEP